MTIVEELWTRIRAAIDDKIIAATNARDQAVTAKDGAVTAQTAAEAAADTAASAAATEVNKLKAGAPEAFDTLLEIANELGENETERAALANSIAGKADKVHTHTSASITDAGVSLVAGYLVRREADSPNIRVSEAPIQTYHATSKYYVDGGLAGKADTSHQHRVVDFPMTDRTNWINNSSHPGKFVYTRPDGYLHGDVPTDTSHVANKQYVDARTPEIRAVTTIPASPTPGVVYLKFG